MYNIPPRPSKLKGAREFKLFREHKGSSTIAVSIRMTLLRAANKVGRLKVFARAVKESPTREQINK